MMTLIATYLTIGVFYTILNLGLAVKLLFIDGKVPKTSFNKDKKNFTLKERNKTVNLLKKQPVLASLTITFVLSLVIIWVSIVWPLGLKKFKENMTAIKNKEYYNLK